MAIPDDTGPDDSGSDNAGGSPGEPGRVSDAEWSRVVEGLIGSAEEHRGESGNGDQPSQPGLPRGAGWIGQDVLAAAVAAWHRLVAGFDGWLRKPPASLTLPAGSQTRFTIGREPACDMTLLDRTVSRWHACLKREDDGWLLTDLGSTNGTRLNGWRVNAPIAVSPGDQVSFGAATFVLTERPGRLR